MKSTLLCTAGLFLVFSITGCCCHPYKKCCKPFKKHDKCCYGASYQGFDQCGCSPYGGQAQYASGQPYMTDMNGCSTCGSTYPVMTSPPGQLQPTPTFQGSGSDSPTPAPPSSSGASTYNQPVPRPIVEDPAPIPNSAAQNGVTRQLQWVPSRL